MIAAGIEAFGEPSFDTGGEHCAGRTTIGVGSSRTALNWRSMFSSKRERAKRRDVRLCVVRSVQRRQLFAARRTRRERSPSDHRRDVGDGNHARQPGSGRYRRAGGHTPSPRSIHRGLSRGGPGHVVSRRRFGRRVGTHRRHPGRQHRLVRLVGAEPTLAKRPRFRGSPPTSPTPAATPPRYFPPPGDHPRTIQFKP